MPYPHAETLLWTVGLPVGTCLGHLQTLPALPLLLCNHLVNDNRSKEHAGQTKSSVSLSFPILMKMCYGCLSQTPLPGGARQGHEVLRSPMKAMEAGLEVGNLRHDDLERSVAGWRQRGSCSPQRSLSCYRLHFLPPPPALQSACY